MRIGFATTDWSRSIHDPETGTPSYGGAGWARCGLIARTLKARGWDVAEGTLVWDRASGRFFVRPWRPGDYQTSRDGDFVDVDLIVLQRWMFASVAAETSTAQGNGQVVVNDVDDHFWALDPRNQAHRSSDPLVNPIENRDLYLEVVKASSAVTVSTPYLGDQLRSLGVHCPIHVLENVVDVFAFSEARQHRPPAPKPTVGWVGGTPWRSGDLETLRGVLGPFLDRHGLRAYHGGHLDGALTFASALGLDPSRVLTRPMVPIWEYPSLFRGFDFIGLVPLSDRPFNRAKSWIKGLEYAAAGVPFVAADLPEYRRLANLGIGRVASKPKEWTRHLTALLDPEVRQADRERNFDRLGSFDVDARIGLWEGTFMELLASAPSRPAAH